MANRKLNPQVEEFLSKDSQWQEEYVKLRQLALECEELTEEFKWMHPMLHL